MKKNAKHCAVLGLLCLAVACGDDAGALTVLRDHPRGIRSVVLDSVSPPTNNIVEDWWTAPASSFNAIFAACAAQPACAAAYPRLEADFYATVNRLDAAPAVVPLQDASGKPVSVNVDGFVLAYTIIMASEHGSVAGIPKMMDDTAKGNHATAPQRISGRAARRSSSGWAAPASPSPSSAPSTPISPPRPTRLQRPRSRSRRSPNRS